MSKAILAAIVSLVLGVLAEASVGVRWNMTGIGCMVSVVIMGAFIIYFNDKKK
ncbi:MAG: binding-protein-dependent transport permease [Oscillospiraceae bacterium]|nr:binding-protein-dependent transport permease [Oscillospiraceae bacterium]